MLDLPRPAPACHFSPIIGHLHDQMEGTRRGEIRLNVAHELGHGFALLHAGGDDSFIIGRATCRAGRKRADQISPEARIAFAIGGNAAELVMIFGGYDRFREHAEALGSNFGAMHFTTTGPDFEMLTGAMRKLLCAGWSRRRLAAFVSREKLIAGLLSDLATRAGLLDEIFKHFRISAKEMLFEREDLTDILKLDTTSQLQEASEWLSEFL